MTLMTLLFALADAPTQAEMRRRDRTTDQRMDRK